METPPNKYWPYPVLPVEEQTDQHNRQINFLERAYARGYKPYSFGSQNFGATAMDRGGVIFYRGRKRWEASLGTLSQTTLTAFVNDFNCAAEAVLQWLAGGDVIHIVDDIRHCLIISRGTGSGFKLHQPPD